MRVIGLALLVMLLSGCAPTQLSLQTSARNIAANASFTSKLIPTTGFNVVSFGRISDVTKPVRFYLEGDGKAWITRNQISLNPTPEHPTALQLAALDQSPNVAYIARPCQFRDTGADKKCTPFYWTDGRYHSDIIQAVNAAIQVWLPSDADVELVGYSGGGAIALLVAAHLLADGMPVKGITTVAGNLDTELFTRHHKVSPTKGSLNPADIADKLKHIPQRHLRGSSDKIIPASLYRSYVSASGGSQCNQLITVDDVAHRKGWLKAWPALYEWRPTCGN